MSVEPESWKTFADNMLNATDDGEREKWALRLGEAGLVVPEARGFVLDRLKKTSSDELKTLYWLFY